MKMRYLNSLMLGILVFFTGIFAGCKDDDELNSAEMVVYLKTDGLSSKEFLFTPTPIGLQGLVPIGLPMQSTRNVLADVSATLFVDDNLVKDYNTLNATKYNVLPKEVYKISNNGLITLKKGELSSKDSLKIQLTDVQKLVEMYKYEEDGYLLPIKIKSASSEDKGVRVSENANVVYYFLKLNEFSNINNVSSTLDGTLADRSQWTASATNSWSSNSPQRAIDGNLNTYWASLVSDVKFSIDMNSSNKIKGIYLESRYFYQGWMPFRFSTVKIETSVDNISWKHQGIAEFVVDQNEPLVAYIYFYNPVDCQYIRLSPSNFLTQTYGSITEINVIK